MAPKTVALGGAACLSIGWLAASLLSPPVAQLQTRQGRATRAAVRDAPPVAFTETLRLKLQRTEAAPVARRNPFVFGSRARAGDATSAAAVADVDRPADPPAAPLIAAPPYTLSGIAANATAGGPVRTAILSDGRTVHLVKAGESIGGYSVAAVDDDAVTLVDASGGRFVISLR